MSSDLQKQLTIACPHCRKANVFDQPYAYHAGFGDQGFMYSDSGHCTLVWSDYDPVIKQFFPPGSQFSKDADIRARFERALRPAPDGGCWRFTNPARCLHCSEPIAASILEQIYYLVYPDSIVTDENGCFGLGAQMLAAPDDG